MNPVIELLEEYEYRTHMHKSQWLELQDVLDSTNVDEFTEGGPDEWPVPEPWDWADWIAEGDYQALRMAATLAVSEARGACDGRTRAEHCDSWLARGRRCPDCPVYYVDELAELTDKGVKA